MRVQEGVHTVNVIFDGGSDGKMVEEFRQLLENHPKRYWREALEARTLNNADGTAEVNASRLSYFIDAVERIFTNPPILMSKGAEAVHSEREAELEREIETQAIKFEKQLEECRKKSADRDKLALQVDQLQARLTLLSDAADSAVNGLGTTIRDVLSAINSASEGEIRF